MEQPKFDLTGRWVTTAIDCDSFSGDLSRLELAELDVDLEYETLQSPGIRVVQMANDLEFTDLETGRRWEGTIAGGQVRYADSDQRHVGGLDFDAYLEVEGTVLEDGLIAGTYDRDWTFRAEGMTFAGGTLCSGRVRRAGADEPDSAVPQRGPSAAVHRNGGRQ